MAATTSQASAAGPRIVREIGSPRLPLVADLHGLGQQRLGLGAIGRVEDGADVSADLRAPLLACDVRLGILLEMHHPNAIDTLRFAVRISFAMPGGPFVQRRRRLPQVR